MLCAICGHYCWKIITSFLLISMLHELKRKHHNTKKFIVWIKYRSICLKKDDSLFVKEIEEEFVKKSREQIMKAYTRNDITKNLKMMKDV